MTLTPPQHDALHAMQHALDDSVTQLDDMAAALTGVMALFDDGALTGPVGVRWQSQLQDKLLPFVTETQAALHDLARDLETACQAGSD